MLNRYNNMNSKRVVTDWLGVGILAVLMLVLSNWMDSRLDRIEAKINSHGERIAHIEGLLAGAQLRLSASPEND